jgi:penicillin-binding protein 1C
MSPPSRHRPAGERLRAALGQLKRLRRRHLRWLFALPPVAFLLFLLFDAAFPFPYSRLNRPRSIVVLDRNDEPLRIFLAADQRWRIPVALDELPPELPRALVAVEDRWFGRHPGVNPLAIARAAWGNLRHGRVISGGSTLAMQIARMADPGPRTLPSKLREAFRGLQLTWHLTPTERLTAYLNLAPYGRNVEGVGAAARFLFGKPANRLSLGEIALLVALPRAPNGLDPVRKPAAALEVRDAVLDRLVTLGVATADQAASARRQSLPRAYASTPRQAPHLTEMLAARWRRVSTARGPASPSAGNDAAARRAEIATTLDLAVQHTAEEQVRGRIRELRQLGIGNAAVVVVEIAGRELRALVGSADHDDVVHQGQVNGAVARRSPGSALKPFLYGLAYDTGMLVPASYLLDVPTDFRGYVPQNYDGRYRGRVTAHDALVQSLNASTVRLLSALGVERLLDLLRAGGLATLDRPATDYGLPLVLGGGEVTLLDLTDLYAALAAGGVYQPLAMLREASAGPPSTHPAPADPATLPANARRLFSAETAALLLRALHELKRPDLPSSWDLTVGAPAVAWKTGTSFGHRDAWAMGVSRRYAIGVWVGNFDGRAVKGISGAENAGPLLFDLFRALEPGASLPEPPGLRIEPIEVCALSHDLPGPSCRNRVTIEYLPGRSKLHGCTLHRPVLVDRDTGELLAGDCLATRPYVERILTVYPPELVAWWRAQGQPSEGAPHLSDRCRGIPGGDPPKIASPDGSTPYRLRPDAPAAYQQVPLVAHAGPEVRALYWYLDGELVATVAPGDQTFLPLARGRHKLVVVDDTGRSDRVEYSVQ